jgi:carboxylesterase
VSIEGAPEGWITDYSAAGSGPNEKIGVLLVHGFTGTPASMRPWAHYLNERGYTVSVPLMPGHGTTWHKVFICALSMGGGNSLYVTAKNQGLVDGLVLVNPMIHIPGIQIKFVHIISRIQKSRASVGDDIKKPGVTEWGYDALPLKGVAQLYKYLKLSRSLLPTVKAPTLVFHSVDDHVLPVSNTEIIMSELGSSDKQRIELTNSYHVATLDYDAETIFENARIFIEERSR